MERWKIRDLAKDLPCSGYLFFDTWVPWQSYILEKGAYEDYMRRLNRGKLMKGIET